MFRRYLVYLGPIDSDSAPESLLCEREPLEVGQRLLLKRRRSPWSATRDVVRVLVGSHLSRADILLQGAGIEAEHIRLYLPKSKPAPNDMKVVEPAKVIFDEKEIGPHDWVPLEHGQVVQLASWLFRFEQEEQ